MNLKEIVLGAAILSVVIGLQMEVVTDHIAAFDTASNNIAGEKTDKLQQLDNISRQTDTARQSAESVQARSNYFDLPGIVEIFRMPLDTIGVYRLTMPIIGGVLNIPSEVVYLGTLFITLTAIYGFAKRNR